MTKPDSRLVATLADLDEQALEDTIKAATEERQSRGERPRSVASVMASRAAARKSLTRKEST